MRNSKAFTLIEIIVAVALVAILSAAIAPSVLNNIAQGRISRAHSDVQALAAAIMKFRAEVGKYPNHKAPEFDPLLPAASEETIIFLASRGPITMVAADNGITDGRWATDRTGGDGVVPNNVTPNWDEFGSAGFVSGDCEDFNSHLMLGRSLATTNNLYDRVKEGQERNPTLAGFRSGIITSDPVDPWGYRYMCNVAGLGKRIGATEALENVWVISAGPNKLFETTVLATGLGATEVLGGDDIGIKIQ